MIDRVQFIKSFQELYIIEIRLKNREDPLSVWIFYLVTRARLILNSKSQSARLELPLNYPALNLNNKLSW